MFSSTLTYTYLKKLFKNKIFSNSNMVVSFSDKTSLINHLSNIGLIENVDYTLDELPI